MLGFIFSLLVGALAGYIAGRIMGSETSTLRNIVLGILGGFVGSILFGLIGIGWAAINVNSFPMVVEMSGAGDVGRFTGYYYTFSMAAQIATPLLSGLLITRLPSGYRTLFPYAVCFSLAALLTMTQVRHGDIHPAAKDSLLEHFDAGD